MAKNRHGVAPYHIWGIAQIGQLEVRIDEFQCARRIEQATFLLAQKLSSDYRGQRVYLGNCQRSETNWQEYRAWREAQNKPILAN